MAQIASVFKIKAKCVSSLCPTCGYQGLYCPGDLATKGYLPPLYIWTLQCGFYWVLLQTTPCSLLPWAWQPRWDHSLASAIWLPCGCGQGYNQDIEEVKMGHCHSRSLPWRPLGSRVPRFHQEHHCLEGKGRECGLCQPKAVRCQSPT